MLAIRNYKEQTTGWKMPTEQAIELAACAYRLNGGFVSTTKERELMKPEKPQVSNRTLIYKAAGLYDTSIEGETKAYKKYMAKEGNAEAKVDYQIAGMFPNMYFLARVPTLEITDEDRALAADIISYTSTMLFKALSGAISDYEKSCLEITKSNEVDFKDLGLVASLATFYHRGQTRLDQDLKRASAAKFSKHVGLPGDKISMKFTTIGKYTSHRYNCSVVSGTDAESNLIFFFSNKHLDAFPVGEELDITAKVKKHTTSREVQAPETVVSYVKILNPKKAKQKEAQVEVS